MYLYIYGNNILKFHFYLFRQLPSQSKSASKLGNSFVRELYEEYFIRLHLNLSGAVFPGFTAILDIVTFAMVICLIYRIKRFGHKISIHRKLTKL